MTIHAHPDDECSKGAATIARLADEGVRAVLVTCTDGGAGELSDPALLEGHGSLADLRASELADAAATLGYGSTHSLGYRDSGMDGSLVDSFVANPVDDVAQRIQLLIERERPDVIVTYDPEYATGHPDHLHCYRSTVRAFELASADPEGPRKLYGCRTHSPAKLAAMHRWLEGDGQASPYERALAAIDENPMTTRIEVGKYLEQVADALRCHRSQVSPDDPWFFSVPPSVMGEIFPFEEFQLLWPALDGATSPQVEGNLFAGLG